MIDDKIKYVSAGFFVVLAILFLGNFLMNYWKPGPYSLLATLNENKQLGGYPREVPVNSSLILYAYIENHENKVELYEVKIYIVNTSVNVNSTFYLHVRPYRKFYVLVGNGKNSTIPFKISFERPGSYKIAILLFAFNGTTFQYTDLYNQLYINSTVG